LIYIVVIFIDKQLLNNYLNLLEPVVRFWWYHVRWSQRV